VEGEADSDVYLAFTPTITLGWISRTDGVAHVFGIDDPEEGWAAGRSAIVHESDPTLSGPRPAYTCKTLLPPGQKPSIASSNQGGNHALGSMLEVLISVETDYQFHQLFGATNIAANYALALWGAVDLRFSAQASTHVRLPYLGIYSDVNDPWDSPDTGNAGDLLNEFRSTWSNNVPNGGDLGHFNSGANLGGGVAWLDVLCNNSYGFAVSGNINGNTPFPVPTTNALTWDFFVTAHELGHNFGTPHTHDYCPIPLDECSGGFGTCQTQTVCTLGTIMSYCHGCPGGMTNIDTQFHPTVSSLITSKAASASCLGTCSTCDQPPLVDFTAAPTTGTAPLLVTLTNHVYGSISGYFWDFGDGATSTSSSTSHVYAFPGTYDVSLSATWSGGVETELKSDLIVVSGGSTAKATIRNGTGANPSIFRTVTLPILGTTWTSTVDGTTLGANGLSIVFGFSRALSGLPTVFGELLVDPSSESLLTNISFFAGGIATHGEPVPNDTSILGLPVYTQALINQTNQLTNALDLILGN
ncbi:MAG: hypothetical protein ACI8PQ_003088, partial [Planctomycetota bacterium]